MERKFKKEAASLDAIFAFIREYLVARGIDHEVEFSIDLVVEEFFTNMVKYNPESRNDVGINISREGNNLVISLVDTDVERFDVTQTREVDTRAPLHERKVGGLGIYIAKRLVDSIDYEYKDRCSKITLVKTLEK